MQIDAVNGFSTRRRMIFRQTRIEQCDPSSWEKKILPLLRIF